MFGKLQNPLLSFVWPLSPYQSNFILKSAVQVEDTCGVGVVPGTVFGSMGEARREEGTGISAVSLLALWAALWVVGVCLSDWNRNLGKSSSLLKDFLFLVDLLPLGDLKTVASNSVCAPCSHISFNFHLHCQSLARNLISLWAIRMGTFTSWLSHCESIFITSCHH